MLFFIIYHPVMCRLNNILYRVHIVNTFLLFTIELVLFIRLLMKKIVVR
jgi:hypothetical protein